MPRIATISFAATSGVQASPIFDSSSSSTSSNAPWYSGGAPGWSSSDFNSVIWKATPPSTTTCHSPSGPCSLSTISHTRPRAPTSNSAGRKTTANRRSPPGANARRIISWYLGSKSRSRWWDPAGKCQVPMQNNGSSPRPPRASTAAASTQSSRRCSSYLEYPTLLLT